MPRLGDLNPYERHKLIINEYVLNKPGQTKLLQRDTSRDKRDIDVIRENHKFLWEDEDASTWEKQLAKKYYDKLFKEYCICDLSRYKDNKIALRWRIEHEVVSGKGQFVCGNKICPLETELRSWEVNFGYVEHSEKKNALVKLRLCPECSLKLNYYSKKREVKRIKKSAKKKPRKRSGSSPGPSRERHDDEPDEGRRVEDEATAMDESKTAEEIEKEEEHIWSQPREVEDLSREDEFEKYLEDLLL